MKCDLGNESWMLYFRKSKIMKYLFLLFALILLPFSGIAQKPDSASSPNIIYWSEGQKLVWTDFDGLAERYSEHAALSVVGLESRMDFTAKEYQISIRTYFDKDESWSKTWTALLLTHEQGHFDLAEIHARKFRKQILEVIHAGRLTTSEFKALHESMMADLKNAQNEYDEATNFSMDYREQLKWKDQIKEELKQLGDHADPEMIVEIQ